MGFLDKMNPLGIAQIVVGALMGVRGLLLSLYSRPPATCVCVLAVPQ
jgi:hypothetical protein